MFQISRGYHETVTCFYIHMVEQEVIKNGQNSTFEEFIKENSYLMDRHLLFKYYSDEVINRSEAAKE